MQPTTWVCDISSLLASLQLKQVPAASTPSMSNTLSIILYFLTRPKSKPKPSPLILETPFSLTTTTFLHFIHLIYPPPHLNWMHSGRARQSHTERLATWSHPSIQHAKRHARLICRHISYKR